MHGILNQVQNNFSVFMLGAMLNILAAIDVAGIIDYSIRAFLGGLVWLVFKLLGDYLTKKMDNDKTKKSDGTDK